MRYFGDSAAALLAAVAAAFLLCNLATGALVQPHDALLTISTRTLIWILAAGAFALAMVCIFAGNSRFKLALVLWFSLNLVVYELGLYWTEAHGAIGYLGGLAGTFGLSASAADGILRAVFLYLLTGSATLLVWSWVQKPVKTAMIAPQEPERLKMTCVLCKGHVEFSVLNLGHKIPCPHCRRTITLMRQLEIKTSCAACNGRIEFPIDALGQTIPCPHCATPITLQRP
jgi:hypothetical protein